MRESGLQTEGVQLQVVVVWQCSEHPRHRGWRDESKPEENMRRGTCDICLAVTAFEAEVVAQMGPQR